MSDETDTTSEVARVLRDHTRIDGMHGDCSCKHVVPLGHSFAAHQAAALAEAGLLREFPGRVDGAGGGETSNNSECPCAACDPGYGVGFGFRMASRMNICPDCGNKRCPKAANHAKWVCSGSNAVGQVGVMAQDAQNGPQGSAEDVPGGDGGSGAADGASTGTLSARLRALIPATYADDGYFGVTALEIGEFADEAERLEATHLAADLRENTEALMNVRAQVERVQALAQWFHDQGQVGYARKVEEAVEGTAPEPTTENPFRMPEDRA